MKIQKLLKFGKEPHLKELLQGKVYINHSSFFKKDIQHGIFDKNEGRRNLLHLKDAVIEIRPFNSTDWKKLNITTGKIESWNDLSDIHIFSLFQITEEETRVSEYFPFSEEIKKMGDYFVVISNPKAFIERMEFTLRKYNYCFERQTIAYYDPSVNQENITPFHKTADFEYQKEFRYLIKGNTKDPLRFDIGSLEDIAEICETSKFQGLKFIWKE